MLRINGAELDVLDVQRPVPGLIVHKVQIPESGAEFTVGDEVDARVDGFHRAGSCQAHSATHIVHAALRELVGPTATQAGSYNKPGYLRFDFSAQHGLSPALRDEIEQRCNEAIRDDLLVTATEMPLQEARAMGAMAMFGEKYPPVVRMVELGGPWSRELCGGTHVQRTSQIGLLSLLGEQSVGSGTRRVEALVSADAFDHLAAERALVHGLTQILRVQPDQLTDRVERLVAELRDAEKQIADLKSAQLRAGVADMVARATDVGGISYVGEQVSGVSGNDLRTLATDIRSRLGDRAGVVVLVGGAVDKPSAVVATNAAARALGARAGALIGIATAELGGRGGGKDDLAQGGGTDGTGGARAVEAVRRALAG